MSNLNAVLLNCPFNDKESTCEPQLLVTIHFKPTLNVKSQDNLLILDETYEPYNRQSFETLSPYVIVISRSEPIIMHSLKFSKFENSTNNCNSIISDDITRTTRKGKIKDEYCSITNTCNQKLKHIFSKAPQNNSDTSSYSIYNLSAPFPYLTAKLRIYKKRHKTWWMIMPPIVLNNLAGTFVKGNFSIILTSRENALQTKKSVLQGNNTFWIPHSLTNTNTNEAYDKIFIKLFDSSTTFPFYQEKTNSTNNFTKAKKIIRMPTIDYEMKFMTKDDSIPASIKVLDKCPTNAKTLCLNMLDEQVPAFNIKIKMPFRENAVRKNILKVKISRIVTDATTKDALQISVDVINKGLKSQEFFITISNCPFSKSVSVITTVNKILLPHISETITFLLPFIMGSNKKVKFNCELIVKANELKILKRSATMQSNSIIVSRRSFEIETHSRCFCVWSCLCHCVGNIETHIDVSICQKMNNAAQKNAGLLINCPPNKDLNENCLMDSMNDDRDFKMHKTYYAIVGIVLIILLIFVFFCCKCFSPRKEDLIVASVEWMCNPEHNLASHSSENYLCLDDFQQNYHSNKIKLSTDCGGIAKNRKMSVSFQNNNKQKTNLLESAFVTLSKQQREMKCQSAEK
ncbi:uncharacterized protein Dmoj_GI23825, isoform F [Drosophila mojavensis]|uniref:Uncharacterized protein, isoform F n=1 Tax=Drosophila mojavensis TaxID=7230 RepID=A0A0Q9X6U7_DROMO|nr:uncharacterized protein Dmoj_GI23825, isoform F [Drosophila mojavensis]